MDNNDFEIRRSLENGLDRTVALLPEILGALLLVLIGWFLASFVRRVLTRTLNGMRFDRTVNSLPAGNMIGRIIEHPSRFVGSFAYWVIFLAFLSFAISALDVPALNAMVVGIYSYIPNIVASILIFLIASAISVGEGAFIQRVLGGSPLGKLIGTALPALTMAIAVFMILNQLKIAEDIVNITYAAIMGSLALGLALAFGLGGRDVASRILTQAYENTQQKTGEIKSEARRAAANTRREARRARNAIDNNS